MGKTRDDEAYEAGVRDGQRGGFLDDAVEGLSDHTTPYAKGYWYGHSHRYDSQGDRYHTWGNRGSNDPKPKSEEVRESARATREEPTGTAELPTGYGEPYSGYGGDFPLPTDRRASGISALGFIGVCLVLLVIVAAVALNKDRYTNPQTAHTEAEFKEKVSRNKAYQDACRQDPYAGFLATSQTIQHSSDGLSWNSLLSLDNLPIPAPKISVVCVFNTSWIRIVLESEKSEVIETKDGGKTWEYIIYHGKEREVKLHTRDKGKTWLKGGGGNGNE